MPTDRLYYRDSYLTEFTARVLETRSADGHHEVVLDRTAFYPEGGGQPSDLGELAAVRVVAVAEREGEVIHRIQGQLPLGEVVGRLDWERRFDHMQQHSGQHLLSQAFERLLAARTVSFHMGPDTSTIDLAISSLSLEQLESAEALANRLVFENRPILVHLVEPSDLARFNLRRGTERTGLVRIVEIPDFDTIPCGGTHCRFTGEVGLVKAVKWERRSGNTRVEFLCGGRALRDYQAKNWAVVGLAAGLSVRDREVRGAVERLVRENGELRHQAELLRNQLLDYRAQELLREARPVGQASVVSAILAGSTPEELKHLAGRLTVTPGRVALLATAGEKSHLVFARSEELPLDVGVLLRRASGPFGGRGGGRPELAQGGIPEGDKVGALLEEALREVRSALAV
ncbi:MAG: alanyl-tRNA editing protein [Chloroflexota bacterium]